MRTTTKFASISLFVLTFFTFIPKESTASHVAGAEIWYEFTGDANNPYDYRVWVLFYRDTTGAPVTLSPSLCVLSSCYSDYSITMTFMPFSLSNPGQDTSYGTIPGTILVPEGEPCVSKNSVDQLEIYRYYADITLNGVCSDWSFAYTELQRNHTDNLGFPGFFYIDAKLNNTLGPNSSPAFITAAGTGFCTSRQFAWYQTAEEPDNDSIYYELGSPLLAQGVSAACPYISQPIGFQPGYSQVQPMTTINGFQLDHRKGVVVFTPTQQENVAIKIDVKEYRFDSVTTNWVQIGSTSRDVHISVVSTCDTTIPPVDLYVSDYFGSTTGRISCNDSAIHLVSNRNILCSSISSDASEFVLIDSSGILRPIVKVGGNNSKTGYTKEFWLKLHQAVNHHDSLTLKIKIGSDQNTIISSCGDSIDDGYTLTILVDCNTPFGIEENSPLHFSLYPNPTGDVIVLEFQQNVKSAELKIISIDGQELIKKTLSGSSNTIDVSVLPKGIYMARILTDGKNQVIKFEKL